MFSVGLVHQTVWQTSVGACLHSRQSGVRDYVPLCQLLAVVYLCSSVVLQPVVSA